jgi:hypothetical protein
MEWARSNTARTVVVSFLVVYLAVLVTEKEWSTVPWFAALLVINLVLWWVHLRSSRREEAGLGLAGRTGLTEPGVDATIAELLDRPAVAAAWSARPDVWRQVSYIEEGDDLATPAEDVAESIWITSDDEEGEWSVSVGDELKPLLDLDVDEDEDPLVLTLRSHPAVAEAGHMDREVYVATLRAPLTLDEFTVLAIRGLLAHHDDAVRRLLA